MAYDKNEPYMIFKVTGVRETVMGLKGAPSKIEMFAARTVQKYAKKVYTEAKNTAPVSRADIPKGPNTTPSGSLKQSIQMISYFNGMGAMVFPERSIAPYRHYAEYGTKARQQKNPPTRFVDRTSGEWMVNREGNTGQMKENRFMTNAKMKYVASMTAELKLLLGKEIQI